MFVFAFGLALAACGGSAPAPATPSAAASASSEAPAAAASSEQPAAQAAEASEAAGEKTSSDTTASAAPAGGGAADATAAKPQASSGEKPSRPPHEILQLKDTVFMLAFDDSDPGKAAQAACAKQSDPKKHAACMRHAREHLKVPDGHRFKQKGDDWYWLAVHLRRNNTLTNLRKVKFEFGDETENSITLKLDAASAKANRLPAQVKIDVPSDYRIVLHDPKYGKLIYEAKVGIAGGGD